MVYNPDDNLYPLPNCKRNSDKKSENKSDYSFELFFKHCASKKKAANSPQVRSQFRLPKQPRCVGIPATLFCFMKSVYFRIFFYDEN